ncbi:MAG TPA: thioredoxin family protein [Polyangiaceae bacterium]|jgi:thiol-disulfide isomerase/thioredoxin|nr:thioredoxin family protein [Polyangiaceae bacterium]
MLTLLLAALMALAPAQRPALQTYGAAGPGHAIKTIDRDGATVTLEDGSVWTVDPRTQYLVAEWQAGAQISVHFTEEDPAFNYILNNDDIDAWTFVTLARPVPAAKDVVAAAVNLAAAGKKVVLVEFGASWCVWCRSFDAFVHAPETAATIGDNYVVVNLTVQERDADKKRLENPGGEALMDAWDGTDAGLPFYVFVNAAGEKIADSNVMKDGSNVGFPGTDEELRVFTGLLDATAPRLTAGGRRAITAYLKDVMKP